MPAESRELVSPAQYRALAEFRYGLRKFVRFSESAARAQGITPQQHQLLLAIKGGFSDHEWAAVSELAERLQLQQHSVVGIIDRSVQAGLVARVGHQEDHRVTEVHLTPKGEAILETLTVAHREELRRMRNFVSSVMRALEHPAEDGEATSALSTRGSNPL